MNWNDYEWIDRKEAVATVKSFMEAKEDFAIRSEGRVVEIYKMERDAILNERLPTYCWLIRCRDYISAKRFVDKLRGLA